MTKKEKTLSRERIILERADLDALNLRFEVEKGFNRLQKLNNEHQETWSKLFPVFRPDAIEDGISVFIVDENLETVACTAARMRFVPRSLTLNLEDLSFIYDNPGETRAACKVGTELADRINGIVVYHGSTWTRPDWRGRGLAKTTSRLVQLFALDNWKPDWITATVRPVHMPAVAPNSYGFDLIGTWLDWFDPEFGHNDRGEKIALLATSRQGLRARLLGLGGERI